MKRGIVIHSPRSGRSAQLNQALEALQQNNIDVVDHFPITELDTLPKQGQKWQEEGIELVIAAGGDGLVGGVTAHLVNTQLPLGIIPLGTANDVARTVGIPIDPVRAAEVVATGIIKKIDLGVAQPAEQQPHPTENIVIPPQEKMYFTHALTVGLNVAFARLATNRDIRQQFGPMTYPVAVMEAVRNYSPINVVIQLKGVAYHPTPGAPLEIYSKPVMLRCRAAQATVVNAPIFWGMLQATVPGVSLQDRLLDVVVVEDISLDQLMFRVARFFTRQDHQPPNEQSWHAQYPELLAAELTDVPGIHHFKAKSVTIDVEGAPHDATLDGEVRGQTPIFARVADENISLIVPATATIQ
ncbi:diacylglycerol kinase family enzyme [Thermosporothrix hazakensis]|jgi:diacylglycerol kinase family enzyme|uniref:Diacylglycerol kinase family enzyme n=2 Tax=Thermosporothrix TaxID=768650 RepID=A0A326U488_THEHA|nr:diacylglycerol kinase family protein [Thermosporothrix hazakensis]PZW27444.1 diacylglycerol kinase family enzyme [Thermosporothrix hazakensis]BBH85964.1 lipid kinase [Thermosporothrix sp. COM3]GCE45611.1 lipid kinase [Thermosporothrix hazakensis]